MGTEIISNGSKWAGEDVDSLEILAAVLATEPLDPTFEKYGNFVYVLDEGHPQDGVTIIHGNFWKLSHVFNICTDDSAVIERLTALIRDNQERDDYKAAKALLVDKAAERDAKIAAERRARVKEARHKIAEAQAVLAAEEE